LVSPHILPSLLLELGRGLMMLVTALGTAKMLMAKPGEKPLST
jgi:hypothetical protein